MKRWVFELYRFIGEFHEAKWAVLHGNTSKSLGAMMAGFSMWQTGHRLSPNKEPKARRDPMPLGLTSRTAPREMLAGDFNVDDLCTTWQSSSLGSWLSVLTASHPQEPNFYHRFKALFSGLGPLSFYPIKWNKWFGKLEKQENVYWVSVLVTSHHLLVSPRCWNNLALASQKTSCCSEIGMVKA